MIVKHRMFQLCAILLFVILIAWALSAKAQDDSSIVGLDRAGPAMAQGTPAIWFGIKSCSQYVIFLVMDDGHMWQVDEENHPKDMDGFLKSIAGVKHQLVTLPCAEQL